MEYRYRDNTLDVWSLLDDQITRPPLPRSGHVHFYPSEASVEITDPVTGHISVVGRCMRASYFRFTNQIVSKGEDPEADTWDESDNSAMQEWKFEISRQTETMLTEQYKRAGVYVDNSVPFLIRDVNIKGELDIVILDPWKSEYVGIEVKSIYGYHGEKQVFGTPTERKLGRKGTPKTEHELQTALYAWFWRDYIKYFKIVYFSRGNAQREQFTLKVVPYTTETGEDFYIYIDGKKRPYTINSILTRIKTLESYLERGDLPPREFDAQYSDDYIKCLHLAGELGKTDTKAFETAVKKNKTPLLKKGDWMCSYCNFFSNCYDNNSHPIADNVIDKFTLSYEDSTVVQHACSQDLYKYIQEQHADPNVGLDDKIEIHRGEKLIYEGDITGFLNTPKIYEPARKVTESSFKLWENTTQPSTT